MFLIDRVGDRARALEEWREAARLVRARWAVFLESEGAARPFTFAQYVSALDAEEAAAAKLAGDRQPLSVRRAA